MGKYKRLGRPGKDTIDDTEDGKACFNVMIFRILFELLKSIIKRGLWKKLSNEQK
jgi:hypothetical protein